MPVSESYPNPLLVEMTPPAERPPGGDAERLPDGDAEKSPGGDADCCICLESLFTEGRDVSVFVASCGHEFHYSVRRAHPLPL